MLAIHCPLGSLFRGQRRCKFPSRRWSQLIFYSGSQCRLASTFNSSRKRTLAQSLLTLLESCSSPFTEATMDAKSPRRKEKLCKGDRRASKIKLMTACSRISISFRIRWLSPTVRLSGCLPKSRERIVCIVMHMEMIVPTIRIRSCNLRTMFLRRETRIIKDKIVHALPQEDQAILIVSQSLYCHKMLPFQRIKIRILISPAQARLTLR
jgi:hypothetical protein